MTRLLVVGDIIEIKEGMTIPADCLVLSSDYLNIDEAMLTGEAEEITKRPGTQEMYEEGGSIDPFLFKGSLCTYGKGEALVLAVG